MQDRDVAAIAGAPAVGGEGVPHPAHVLGAGAVTYQLRRLRLDGMIQRRPDRRLNACLAYNNLAAST